MNAKKLKDYVGIPEFFPGIIANAKPIDLKSQLFVIDIETAHKRWGDEMFLSAPQIAWLLDLQTEV